MAKRIKPAAHEIEVQAIAGFKHRGIFIRTGEVVTMTKAEAADMRALNMARPVERERTDG
jgi:hypothetical protein